MEHQLVIELVDKELIQGLGLRLSAGRRVILSCCVCNRVK